MKSNRVKILEMYFNKKMRQIDIANILNLSQNAISKVVKKDSRYEEEKNARKRQNKIKHNKEIQKRVEIKRKNVGASDTQLLKKMHEQASLELSGGKRHMGNRAFRNWNSSIYKYNNKSQTYVLKKGITVSSDVPKRINWKNF